MDVVKDVIENAAEEVLEAVTETSSDIDSQEYITFTVTTRDGAEVEMAVVDEFEFEKKHYVVGALIENDVVKEDGCYIYRSVFKGDDFSVEKITNEADYQKITEAYMNL